MGKWNRRYYPRSNRRGRYQDYDWSPPRETYRDPELGVWQDNVPMWEKKFCFLSGVPWEKVLSTSKFMHCQSNIIEWDDTAGKEAFHNAKESYLANLNSTQSEIHTPDPDAYIGKIDWNPNIDPELIKDLDRTFKDPLDHDHDHAQSSEALKNKTAGLNQWDDSVEEPTNNNPQNISFGRSEDPWNCDRAQSSEALKNKAVGWNQWEDSVDTHEDSTNNNPWDRATTNLDAQTSEVSKYKATVWNNNNSWQCGESQMMKNNGWGQCNRHVNVTEKRSNYGNTLGYNNRYGTNNYGSRDWRQQSYSNRGGNNNHCETGISRSSYYNGGSSRDRRNDWSQNNNYGGQYGDRGRKREGSGQNMNSYKGPKLHYTDESSRRWNNESNDKRVWSSYN